jgi:hypothetical protein
MSTEANDFRPVFLLNGAPVALEPQDRGAFTWLAAQVYRRIHEGQVPPPIPALLTVIAHEGVTAQGLPAADARVQACMLVMWAFGIKAARVEGEGDGRQVKWEKGEHANIDARPVIEHFTEQGIREGRALASALLVASSRRIRINGIEVPVRINNMELLQAQAPELEKRRKDPAHDPAMAAAAYVAELLSAGADQGDLRLRAALEFAGDLGIRSMVIDAPTRQLRIDGFNEQAALAGAYLQGVPVEQFQAALTRVQTLNRMAEDQSRLIEQQARGQGPGATRAQAMVSPMPPKVASAGVPVKRRRR